MTEMEIDSPPRRHRPGPIEKSVRAWLRTLSKKDRDLVAPEAEMLLRMSRAYDAYTGIDLAKLARLNMELRQTLGTAREAVKHDDSGASQLPTPEWSSMPAAVRDTANTGKADDRTSDS